MVDGSGQAEEGVQDIQKAKPDFAEMGAFQVDMVRGGGGGMATQAYGGLVCWGACDGATLMEDEPPSLFAFPG